MLSLCHGLHLTSSTRGPVNSSRSKAYLQPWKRWSNVFSHFGIPEDIVSDRGPQYISRVWRGLFKLLGVSVSLSSGYHPQTNGQTERKIQEIGRYLRAYCHDHQHD
ncbi:hypothetical protein QTP86_019978, partial [Hemibagrus guttatus]